MRPRAVTASLLLLPLLSGASVAEQERFRLERTADGYVRMDTRTGELSMCKQSGGELVCRLAADERTAMQDQIERLQADVENLKDRVGRLEDSLAARGDRSLPTEEEFDRSLSYMERFFRSFMGIVKDFERDEEASPGQGSGRT
jgi:hypothetical protein